MSKFIMLDFCFTLMGIIGEGFSTGVTLFVDGVVVSGNLIHPLAYYRGISKGMETASGTKESMTLTTQIAKMLNEAIGGIESEMRDAKNDDHDPSQEEIYLSDVRLLSGLNPITLNNAFLSVRIESIDGFIWGSGTIDRGQ